MYSNFSLELENFLERLKGWRVQWRTHARGDIITSNGIKTNIAATSLRAIITARSNICECVRIRSKNFVKERIHETDGVLVVVE